MRYNRIRKTDISNGPGIRVSIFMQGCAFHCKNCFNSETWDFDKGQEFDDNTIKEELANLYNRVGTEDDVTPIISRLQTIYDNILSNNVDYAEYIYYKKDIVKYLALAYIKNDDLEKAKKLLKPNAEDGDDEAAEIIKAIDSL